MLVKTFLIALIAFQVNLKTCQNNKSAKTNAFILGLWKGNFTTNDGSKGEFYFSVKPGGKLFIENNFKGVQRLANGNWSLNGNSFSATGIYFYGSPENIGTVTDHKAVFDGNLKLEQGVWTNTNPNEDTGNFTLCKIK